MSLGEATHLATRYQDHISPVASAGLGILAVQSARKLHLEVRRVQLTASLLLRPKGANQGCNNHSAQGQPTIPSRPTSKHCTINTQTIQLIHVIHIPSISTIHIAHSPPWVAGTPQPYLAGAGRHVLTVVPSHHPSYRGQASLG